MSLNPGSVLARVHRFGEFWRVFVPLLMCARATQMWHKPLYTTALPLAPPVTRDSVLFQHTSRGVRGLHSASIDSWPTIESTALDCRTGHPRTHTPSSEKTGKLKQDVSTLVTKTEPRQRMPACAQAESATTSSPFVNLLGTQCSPGFGLSHHKRANEQTNKSKERW